MDMTMTTIYDLSIKITQATTVFPDDTPAKIETVMDLQQGDVATVHRFCLSSHTGTHMDFPAHMIKDGKNSDDYPIEYLMGHGCVIEIPEDQHVSAQHVEDANIQPGDIVFFKTNNTRQHCHNNPYNEHFIALEPDAGIALVKNGAKIVGIDYLSIDQYKNKQFPVHHTLLGNGVLIIENLNLENIPAGKYHFTIAPLNIATMDGLPVRVIARTKT
jgi:arylformamidase